MSRPRATFTDLLALALCFVIAVVGFLFLCAWAVARGWSLGAA